MVSGFGPGFPGSAVLGQWWVITARQKTWGTAKLPHLPHLMMDPEQNLPFGGSNLLLSTGSHFLKFPPPSSNTIKYKLINGQIQSQGYRPCGAIFPKPWMLLHWKPHFQDKRLLQRQTTGERELALARGSLGINEYWGAKHASIPHRKKEVLMPPGTSASKLLASS